MPIIPSQVPFFSEPVPPSMDFRKTLLWQSPRHDTTELINVRNTKEELNFEVRVTVQHDKFLE
jgi:hypothetical protein